MAKLETQYKEDLQKLKEQFENERNRKIRILLGRRLRWSTTDRPWKRAERNRWWFTRRDWKQLRRSQHISNERHDRRCKLPMLVGGHVSYYPSGSYVALATVADWTCKAHRGRDCLRIHLATTMASVTDRLCQKEAGKARLPSQNTARRSYSTRTAV